MIESGGSYKSTPVDSEAYVSIAAYKVNARDAVPSGATVINGVYFIWNNSGFTGHSFYTNIPYGPTASYGFKSDQAVIDYITANINLDDVFASWNPTFDEFMYFADLFRTGGEAYGCADFDIGTES